ncbi:MAG: hypothetical protein U0264_09270 [Candidatus Kapaibacterium sp.]
MFGRIEEGTSSDTSIALLSDTDESAFTAERYGESYSNSVHVSTNYHRFFKHGQAGGIWLIFLGKYVRVSLALEFYHEAVGILEGQERKQRTMMAEKEKVNIAVLL